MTQNKMTKIVMPIAVMLALTLTAPAYAQRRGGGGGDHATAGARGGAPVGTVWAGALDGITARNNKAVATSSDELAEFLVICSH